jgi:hypothetical protein
MQPRSAAVERPELKPHRRGRIAACHHPLDATTTEN